MKTIIEADEQFGIVLYVGDDNDKWRTYSLGEKTTFDDLVNKQKELVAMFEAKL